MQQGCRKTTEGHLFRKDRAPSVAGPNQTESRSLSAELPIESTKAKRNQRKAKAVEWMVMLWIPVFACFYLWQVYSGRGFYGYLMELEFASLGRGYPAATLISLIGISSIPVVVVFFASRSRRPVSVAAAERARRVRDDAVLFRNWLVVLTTTFFGVALVVSVIALLPLPRSASPARISADAPWTFTPAEGSTTLSGYVAYTKSVGFTRNVGSAHYGTRFVPIGGAEGRMPVYRFLVQLPAKSDPGIVRDKNEQFTGLLIRNDLPGPVRQLLATQGVVIASPHYVLYTNYRWSWPPELLFATEMLIAGIFCLLITYFQHRQLRQRPARPVA